MLSTNIMQEVEAICNRVIIIKQGNIITDGTTTEIKKISEGTGQQVHFSTFEKIKSSDLSTVPYIAKVEEIAPNEFLITSAI